MKAPCPWASARPSKPAHLPTGSVLPPPCSSDRAHGRRRTHLADHAATGAAGRIRAARRLGLPPHSPTCPLSPRSSSLLSLSFVLERRPTRSPPFSVVLAATKTRSPRRPVQPLRLPRLRLPDEPQDAGRPGTLPRPRLPLRITGARRRRSTAQLLLNLRGPSCVPPGELLPSSFPLLAPCLSP